MRSGPAQRSAASQGLEIFDQVRQFTLVQLAAAGNFLGSVSAGENFFQRASSPVVQQSNFTKDALEFVEALPQKIVLVDGKQLASLMIEHDVGVSATKSYTLKRLDQDYFENL